MCTAFWRPKPDYEQQTVIFYLPVKAGLSRQAGILVHQATIKDGGTLIAINLFLASAVNSQVGLACRKNLVIELTEPGQVIDLGDFVLEPQIP